MHFLGDTESKQVFVSVMKCAKLPYAFGMWARSVCCSACTDSACLPSSDLLKIGGHRFQEKGLSYNC